jgi:hypothetical protein
MKASCALRFSHSSDLYWINQFLSLCLSGHFRTYMKIDHTAPTYVTLSIPTKPQSLFSIPNSLSGADICTPWLSLSSSPSRHCRSQIQQHIQTIMGITVLYNGKGTNGDLEAKLE